MKQTFKNFKFYLAESDRPRYHKVDVTFAVDGERHQESLYIKNVANKKDQYYIDEAKKQVEKHTGQNLNPTKTRTKKSKKAVNASEEQPTTPVASTPANKAKYYGNRRPATIVLAAISLVAVVAIGLFTWKFFFNNGNNTGGGGGGGGESTTITLSKEAEENIDLEGEKIIIGEDYKGKIIVNEEMGKTLPYINPNEFKVTCQKKALTAWVDYRLDRITRDNIDDPQTYEFTIEGKSIKDAIQIISAGLQNNPPKGEQATVELDKESEPLVKRSSPDFAPVGSDYDAALTLTEKGQKFTKFKATITINDGKPEDVTIALKSQTIEFVITYTKIRHGYKIIIHVDGVETNTL